MDTNDLRVLRDRQEAIDDAIDRSAYTPPDTGRSLLCQTTKDATYPTSAGVMYCVVEVEASGSEQEGAAPGFTAESPDNKFYALNLGTGVPPNPTTVVCKFAGGKWCFRYDG